MLEHETQIVNVQESLQQTAQKWHQLNELATEKIARNRTKSPDISNYIRRSRKGNTWNSNAKSNNINRKPIPSDFFGKTTSLEQFHWSSTKNLDKKEQSYLNSLKHLIEESELNPEVPVHSGDKQVMGFKVNAMQRSGHETVTKKSPKMKRLSVSDVAELAFQKKQQRKIQKLKSSALLRELQGQHLGKLEEDKKKLEVDQVRTGHISSTNIGVRKWRRWKIRMEFYKTLRKKTSFGASNSFEILSNEESDFIPKSEAIVGSSAEKMASLLLKLDELKVRMKVNKIQNGRGLVLESDKFEVVEKR